MSMKEIQQAITTAGLTQKDLQSLIEFTQEYKTRRAKELVFAGDNVVVVQKTKFGRDIRTPGVVKNVKLTQAVVAMRGGVYNVPLNMIEPA